MLVTERDSINPHINVCSIIPNPLVTSTLSTATTASNPVESGNTLPGDNAAEV